MKRLIYGQLVLAGVMVAGVSYAADSPETPTSGACVKVLKVRVVPPQDSNLAALFPQPVAGFGGTATGNVTITSGDNGYKNTQRQLVFLDEKGAPPPLKDYVPLSVLCEG